MAYPMDVLTDDEVVVVHKHPHIKALIGPGLVLLVVTALAAWGLLWSTGDTVADSTATVVGVAAGVVWLAAFAWFVVKFVSWRTTHFVITDKRVMFRQGVITRSGIDIPVLRINSVQFRHGLIDRILRTGTLIVESASDDPLEFDDIPRVEQVHALLYARLDDRLDDDDDRGPAAR
ncbi:MAG: PH domain-containing protein [Cellulomonas sp.]|uniref:PH domain-containing protein n=1 Tax=Cellulomonas sp. A375-1 TaxID=1672219 RepID=UPI0006527C4C|nr:MULTISPECIES: PH domain-containing protein [unclassified Cellulomonas]KMM45141.1 membrane protein [Cellulomonas sp. A375-1]MCR6648226.1 PH domain-containing protein [Cellulomonas sp.]